jgi:hypothetical protein
MVMARLYHALVGCAITRSDHLEFTVKGCYGLDGVLVVVLVSDGVGVIVGVAEGVAVCVGVSVGTGVLEEVGVGVDVSVGVVVGGEGTTIFTQKD